MKALLTAALLSALSLSPLHSGPLDAPGEKKITVGSEIARGYHEATGRVVTSVLLDYCIAVKRQILDVNASAGTDSDGFKIGVYYGEWETLTAFLRQPGINKVNSREHMQFAAEQVLSCFKIIRDYEVKLGIDDVTLIRGTGAYLEEGITAKAAEFSDYETRHVASR